MQYSHNQANVHKGLQVVFNTHENKSTTLPIRNWSGNPRPKGRPKDIPS